MLQQRKKAAFLFFEVWRSSDSTIGCWRHRWERLAASGSKTKACCLKWAALARLQMCLICSCFVLFFSPQCVPTVFANIKQLLAFQLAYNKWLFKRTERHQLKCPRGNWEEFPSSWWGSISESTQLLLLGSLSSSCNDKKKSDILFPLVDLETWFTLQWPHKDHTELKGSVHHCRRCCVVATGCSSASQKRTVVTSAAKKERKKI